MIIIEDVLINEDIVIESFVCQLSACKGACCWLGDFGAPLSNAEIETIEQSYSQIKPYLTNKSVVFIEGEGGFFEYNTEINQPVTKCHDDGACVFLTFDENGIGQCGIEKANASLSTPFKKPISCHLYPIRVSKNNINGFEMWQYDRWDICSNACHNGKKLGIPIYVFLKEAIIRYKGEEFYQRLDAAALHYKRG